MAELAALLDEKNDGAITEDEAALYDRQIRLWGLDAQKRFVSGSGKMTFKSVLHLSCAEASFWRSSPTFKSDESVSCYACVMGVIS